MTTTNYAIQPLRPLADTHGAAGVYLVELQCDALQEPFTTAAGSTQEVTAAGDIACDVWEHIHAVYANQVCEGAVVTSHGITALIRLFEPSVNQDHEPEDGSFFVAHSAECPCCAAIAAQGFGDGPEALHVFYEFHGSAAEFVMEVRSEIARAVWSSTGQRGTQFWATIHIEPVADISTILDGHRDAMERNGIAFLEDMSIDGDSEGMDFSQN